MSKLSIDVKIKLNINSYLMNVTTKISVGCKVFLMQRNELEARCQLWVDILMKILTSGVNDEDIIFG